MGLREIEDLFMIKLVVHVIISVSMLLWILNKERKLRYHKLLVYLCSVSLLLSIVSSFDKTGLLQTFFYGGFILVLSSATK